MKSKAEVRAEARARLAAIDSASRQQFADQIGASIWEVPQISEARVLMLYASLPAEVSTDGIAEEAWRRGVQVIYPRCITADRSMTLHRIDSIAGLNTGSYGIREPGEDCPDVSVEEVDAVLMPGLGWDRRGNRLGRGAGYYDRLLSRPEWRAFTCGIFFAGQEFVRLPTDEWDIPLSTIVTERETIQFSR